MTIADDIKYIGVNDHDIDLFEGQFVVPLGMAYNSYLVKDEKALVFDTVDARFGDEWLANIRKELGERPVDYLVVQHMEPDHSANIARFASEYPSATIVAGAQAFAMIKSYFGTDYADRRVVVKEGDTLSTGRHEFTFVAAPMVHWPEVMVTYDKTEKILFSADGFGKFGANDREDPEGWDCEARRYYFGIVGKFGAQVQALLKKASALEIRTICPLHGPVLNTPEEIAHVVKQYSTWSSYAVETPGGVLVAYTSVYGHTKAAALKLVDILKAKGCPKVAVADLARDDQPETIEDAFRYGKVVLATTTYNTDIFPWMRHFIWHLVERNYQSRRIGLIENGSWAPSAAKVMKGMFANSKGISFCDTVVTIRGALDAASEAKLSQLADEILAD
ncbi:MAG: MBL fold metallo-hydrolase [Lentisphaerae bacterium]|jgi:flavorubredoxin|nr:MBL fold metallo-hydrolase [Lentisphaerota bacterium]